MSYVDIEELQEALRLHFAGELDYVNPVYVNNSLLDLVPGKPLLSQLESSQLTIALDSLPLGFTQAIIDEFNGGRVRGAEYIKAIALLAEVVLELLD